MAKKEQHSAVGVDSEIQDLFAPVDGGAVEGDEEPTFMLPEIRKSVEPPNKTEPEGTPEDKKIDKDAEYARSNLYELIEHGMAAVQDLSHLSREQMHPRTYEVFSKLMKEVADNNLSLLELANKKKDAKKGIKSTGGETPNGQVNIDKAIFVGTTSDLIKAMNKTEG